ncbi:hypothetical protein Sango_0359900 [Sesamum angolense]|uniref:Mitochondrial protein n=1 Tax=Sesamum angolense TaxID=2727404 RepID=A0AAE1XAJ6_9LAMI|nr:hypothetical protein Sango_0359900 [Sesamum angolense]
MQFVMGLDESFESTRNQILMMEPLPNVSKAYAIVLQVERQKEVNSAYGNSLQNMAMQTKGFQNWYKTLMDQRKNGATANSRALNATGSQTRNQESVQNAMDNEAISEFVRNEMRRIFRQDNVGTSNREDTFQDYDDYAVGKLVGKLYILDDHSFNADTIKHMIEQEPKSCNQESKLEDWKAAMQSELDALEKNNSWELTTLPKNKRSNGCRWIFELKLNVEPMQSELDALEKNNSWELTTLPKNKRSNGCRWIFELKLNVDGSVDKHKARFDSRATIK